MKKEEVKVAYLLLVHNKVEQLNLFLKQILRYGKCDIYIHVDKKNKEMMDLIKKDPHVKIISKYEVGWASFSIIEGTIELMRTVLNSGEKYTHIYYGSGEDLLVKNGMYEYLAMHSKNIFMDLYWGKQAVDKMAVSARYKVCWPECLKNRNAYHPARFARIIIQLLCNHGVVLFKNKISIDHLKLDIYCGSQWFIAPFEVMQYFIEYLDWHPEYIEFWRKALAPDELFFQTLVMNSKYVNYVQPSLMYYRAGKTFSTRNHPMLITEKNKNEITSGIYFCARKFSEKKFPKCFNYYLQKIDNAYRIC